MWDSLAERLGRVRLADDHPSLSRVPSRMSAGSWPMWNASRRATAAMGWRAAAFIAEGEAAIPAPAGVAWAAQHRRLKADDGLPALPRHRRRQGRRERGHSWRHTVATIMEDAGVPDARCRYIIGRAPRDDHAKYLHHAAARLREAIETVPTVLSRLRSRTGSE
jgi:hypothetical protein